MSRISKLLPSEVRPLTAGAIFHAPPEDLTPEETVEAYAVLQFIEAQVDERKKALRTKLLAEAEAKGTPTDKGSSKLHLEGALVLREKRQASAPQVDDLAEVLEKAKVAVNEVFDPVVMHKLNPSKLNQLIQTGRLDGAEIEKLYKVTYALRVIPGTNLQNLLNLAAEKYEASALPPKSLPPKPF